MIYYIADTHFGHQRVMELCHRNFKDLDEMREVIVNNWNNVVTDEDTVYVVGDFAYDDESAKVIYRLKGKKILLLGNHDDVLSKETLSAFEKVDKILTIKDRKRSVCICHYPMLSYENSIYGGYHVFGHIHNNEKDIAYRLQKRLRRSFNCGVDVVGFTPRTLDELIEMKRNNQI